MSDIYPRWHGKIVMVHLILKHCYTIHLIRTHFYSFSMKILGKLSKQLKQVDATNSQPNRQECYTRIRMNA